MTCQKCKTSEADIEGLCAKCWLKKNHPERFCTECGNNIAQVKGLCRDCYAKQYRNDPSKKEIIDGMHQRYVDKRRKEKLATKKHGRKPSRKTKNIKKRLRQHSKDDESVLENEQVVGDYFDGDEEVIDEYLPEEEEDNEGE